MCSSLTRCPTLPPKQRSNNQVELGGKIRLACSRGTGMSTQHKQATFRKRPEIPAGQMTEPPAHPVAHHCLADRPAHHEPHHRGLPGARTHQQVPRQQGPAGPAAAAHRCREVVGAPHPRGCREHSRHLTAQPGRAGSDAEPLAALPAPRGQHRAAGPGAHAQPESVRLRAAAIIRLERTLAHGISRYRSVTVTGGHDPRAAQRTPERRRVTGPRNATRSSSGRQTGRDCCTGRTSSHLLRQ
jgi:hypothetical protein